MRFISHEVNCYITHYRFVRYYKNYVDDTDFDLYGTHDNVYLGRSKKRAVESESSRNLLEACPDGVFTDKPYSEHCIQKIEYEVCAKNLSIVYIDCNNSSAHEMMNCTELQTVIMAAPATISYMILDVSILAMTPLGFSAITEEII